MIDLFATRPDFRQLGLHMHELITELYPICRSITGNGVRQTLDIIGATIPLTRHEVPTGTRVFDWAVPKEWNINDAWIENSRGERIVDFRNNNLHVLNYSVPVNKTVGLSELKEHLYTLPEHPDWIPYRTSYYQENWGFCLSHRQMEALPEDRYKVVIDSSLDDGFLSYGEYLIPGETEEEILLSCHICHPSLCNDNLSGIALMTKLAQLITGKRLRYSYRFLFIPGTIGSITWLARNEAQTEKIKHGLVVTCVGDSGPFTYKKSRRGNADIDRTVQHILRHERDNFELVDFYPYGYDERQYCSPGFNLPVGSLSRSSHGCYPEYHTSADNLDLVKPQYLAESLEIYLQIIDLLENDGIYINQNPKCEPQLGKRGLYRSVGATAHHDFDEMSLLWVLNLTDGEHSLLEIAERADTPFRKIKAAARALIEAELLKPREHADE